MIYACIWFMRDKLMSNHNLLVSRNVLSTKDLHRHTLLVSCLCCVLKRNRKGVSLIEFGLVFSLELIFILIALPVLLAKMSRHTLHAKLFVLMPKAD